MSGGTVATIESSALLDERQAQASPRAESNPVARKRRMTEQPLSQKTPKTPRRAGDPPSAAEQTSDYREPAEYPEEQNFRSHEGPEDHQVDCRLSRKPPVHPDPPRKRLEGVSRRDDSARLRKTIQWLEDGARKLREELALARSELHEERKAARIARREVEAAVRETRNSEAAKYQKIIADLRTRLSRSPSRGSVSESTSPKAELLREENRRREIMATKKRLAEADEVIRKLRSNSVDSESTRKKRKFPEEPSELHRLECESRNLRETIRRLEEKLQFAAEAEKSRALEFRVQYEKHEVEMNALKKAQRSDMVKMMQEIRAKGREIEKLEKFAARKANATRDQLVDDFSVRTKRRFWWLDPVSGHVSRSARPRRPQGLRRGFFPVHGMVGVHQRLLVTCILVVVRENCLVFHVLLRAEAEGMFVTTSKNGERCLCIYRSEPKLSSRRQRPHTGATSSSVRI